MSEDFKIALPNWPPLRLLGEACQHWNIYRAADVPAADPIESEWPLLCNVVHAYLRHSHCAYDQALAAGADRDELRRRIGEAAARAYPWLRLDHDP